MLDLERVRVLIIPIDDRAVEVHMSCVVEIPRGTRVYHKTLAEFPPTENRSLYYTLTQPMLTLTDFDFRVLQYETVQDTIALYDLSRAVNDPITPLKYALCFECSGCVPRSCLDLLTHMPDIVRHVRATGFHAVVSRMDRRLAAMEIICTDPASLLRFTRESRVALTNLV